MQCLFCGKELALLKRLRGGGEFCSEAHRKEYQEQYEQLALARLLQAKPQAEPGSSLDRPAFPLPGAPNLAGSRETPYVEAPTPAFVATIDEPHSVMAKAASQKRPEESGPAPLAGFLNEPMVPAVTAFEHAGLLESESVSGRVTTLPSLPPFESEDSEAIAFSASHESLPPAPRVALEISLQALDHHTRRSERGVELREFTGPAPVMELNLRPGTGTEPAGAAEVMEILMLPHPPQKAKPWLGVPRGFPAAPAELGDLARLDFATTGFGQPEGFAYSDAPVAASRAQTTSVAPAEPAPEVHAPAPEPPLAAESAPPEPAAPERVTTVLPVTLHGVAAPHGKFTQPFPSALIAASDVQTPPSTALPLRPTIVFGPAPVSARVPESTAAPIQARPVQVKPVQAAPAPSVPASKPVPVKRTQAPPAPAPPVEPRVERVEPRVEPRAEPRVEPRVESRNDWNAPKPETAGPSLHLDATESAWAKLSPKLKIGVAAAVIVALSGIGYLVTRGNKPTSEPPPPAAAPISVASGVPISGGWIDDWANAARTNRHISLLSGSTKLSDYRLEFQAQIETKAIGWIFRGLNPRNYYVTKLEIVKPGLEPTVALVHFAVVDGQDESRVVVPLPMKVRVDTNYKIRFDVVGNHFTTWVQDQKVAEWTDSRFGSGGVGFFSERDEKAAMQGAVNVVSLVPKN